MNAVVEVHTVDLMAPWEHFLKILSPSEHDRRNALVFEEDRRAFTVCRGKLRQILGSKIGVPPEKLEFHVGKYGKPYLHGKHPAFNVSHSGRMGLIAIGNSNPVGVDIEKERSLDDTAALAKRHFTAKEQKRLFELPRELQTGGFFRCWSRKEAFIKAIGMGLSFPLDNLEVSLDPRMPAQIKRIEGSYASEPWVLHHLNICPGYSAALVTRGNAHVEVLF